MAEQERTQGDEVDRILRMILKDKNIPESEHRIARMMLEDTDVTASILSIVTVLCSFNVGMFISFIKAVAMSRRRIEEMEARKK